MEPPSTPVQIMLASLFVHADEAFGPGGHEFDAAAMLPIIQNPEVRAWIESIDPVLLPQKRGPLDG